MWKGGVVASWLVRLSLDPVVQVQTLVGDIVLCSWGRHFTLTVPLMGHLACMQTLPYLYVQQHSV